MAPIIQLDSDFVFKGTDQTADAVAAPVTGPADPLGPLALLPGIGDPETLRTWSSLGGDYEAVTTSLSTTVGSHGRLRPSSSRSAVSRSATRLSPLSG